MLVYNRMAIVGYGELSTAVMISSGDASELAKLSQPMKAMMEVLFKYLIFVDETSTNGPEIRNC